MIAETGHFSLILTLVITMVGAAVAAVGVRRQARSWMAVAVSAASVQAFLLTLAGAALIYAFVVDDFSLLTVAEAGHTDKPLFYKIAASWSGQDGSILLWVWLMSLFGSALALFPTGLERPTRTLALTILALVEGAFLAFLLFAGHPFARLVPAPLNGMGLNPLLLDVGLAIHPPLLYAGYGGLGVVFALACAALIRGSFDTKTAGVMRRFALIGWTGLTLGLGFGAWWSYRTLGWGGWWAWDPVENAALMPWLVATALIHVLGTVQRRGILKAWAVFLALTAFILALFGVLLARTGIVASVHAFADGPALAVLLLLVVVGGAAFILFAARARTLRDTAVMAIVSRESGLLFATLVLMTAAATVLIGTLYPAVLASLGGPRVSVGPPYFETLFAMLALPLTALMAVTANGQRAWRWALAGLAAAAGLYLFAPGLSWSPLLVGAAVWAAGAIRLRATDVQTQSDRRSNTLFYSFFSRKTGNYFSVRRSGGLGRGMAHGGLVLLLVGLAGAPWGQDRVVLLHPGGVVAFAGYELTMTKGQSVSLPDGSVLRVLVDVRRGGQRIATLAPEVRDYDQPPMSKAVAAVFTGFTGDVMTVLGGREGDGYVLRLMFRPLQGLVFAAMVLMALGGLLAFFSRVVADGTVASAPRGAGRGGLLRLLPLMVLAGLVLFLVLVLTTQNAPAPPTLSRPCPVFDLPSLDVGGAVVKSSDFQGKTTIVTFFASWCAPCRTEAGALRTLAKSGVPIVGIAYKDKPGDTRAFLAETGNPYSRVAVDRGGRTAIDFGLTGVPETYVIDKTGTIRFKQSGPLTETVVKDEILPLMRGLP